MYAKFVLHIYIAEYCVKGCERLRRRPRDLGIVCGMRATEAGTRVCQP